MGKWSLCSKAGLYGAGKEPEIGQAGYAFFAETGLYQDGKSQFAQGLLQGYEANGGDISIKPAPAKAKTVGDYIKEPGQSTQDLMHAQGTAFGAKAFAEGMDGATFLQSAEYKVATNGLSTTNKALFEIAAENAFAAKLGEKANAGAKAYQAYEAKKAAITKGIIAESKKLTPAQANAEAVKLGKEYGKYGGNGNNISAYGKLITDAKTEKAIIKLSVSYAKGIMFGKAEKVAAETFAKNKKYVAPAHNKALLGLLKEMPTGMTSVQLYKAYQSYWTKLHIRAADADLLAENPGFYGSQGMLGS